MKDSKVGMIFLESGNVNEDAIRSVKQVGNNVVRMEAVLQDVDSPNRNFRVYTRKVLEESLKSEFIQEKLRTKSLLGESNHPDSKEGMSRQLRIDMNNVSHVVKDIYWDKKDPKVLLGIVETAGTMTGKNLAGLILENGMECSFSMRGAGDVVKKGNGIVEVVSPLRIITWDCVHFPSHKAAYQRRIMNESDNSFNVTTSMVAEYIAENSENTRIINESFLTFSKDQMKIDIRGDKVMITENATGKIAGFAYLDKKLKAEYDDILLSLK